MIFYSNDKARNINFTTVGIAKSPLLVLLINTFKKAMDFQVQAMDISYLIYYICKNGHSMLDSIL